MSTAKKPRPVIGLVGANLGTAKSEATKENLRAYLGQEIRISMATHKTNLPTAKITTAGDVVPFIREVMGADLKVREMLVVVYLNAAGKAIGYLRAHIGGVDSLEVDPRVVFAPGLKSLAKSIVIAHNHPTGYSSPSKEDERMTERLKKAGKTLGIALLDHVIITGKDFYSFVDSGHFDLLGLGIPTLTEKQERALFGVVTGGLSGTAAATAAGVRKTTYKEVTKRLVALIEKEGLVWRKGWKTRPSHWANYDNKSTPYTGANRFLLDSFCRAGQPWFMTKHQIQQRGGTIHKGATPYDLVFFKPLMVPDKDAPEGEEKLKRIPFLQTYRVYNIEDVEGMKLKLEPPRNPTPKEQIEACEKILAGMPNRPTLKYGGGRAFYRQTEDLVQMPHKEDFNSMPEYYSTFFHELVHSTGHPKRLHRDKRAKQFGDEHYSYEELIAEIGASYISAEAGILFHTLDNSAAYVKGWKEQLLALVKKDDRFFFKAASEAQRAADYIIGDTDLYGKHSAGEGPEPKGGSEKPAKKPGAKKPKADKPKVEKPKAEKPADRYKTADDLLKASHWEKGPGNTFDVLVFPDKTKHSFKTRLGKSPSEAAVNAVLKRKLKELNAEGATRAKRKITKPQGAKITSAATKAKQRKAEAAKPNSTLEKILGFSPPAAPFNANSAERKPYEKYVSEYDRTLYEAAKRAAYWNSMDPDRSARVEVGDYYMMLKNLHAKGFQIASKGSAFSKEEYEADFVAYVPTFRSKYMSYLSAKGKTANTMVTGGSGFNHRRNQKALDGESRRYAELSMSANGFIKRVSKRYRPEAYAIKGGQGAVEKLQAKLDVLVKQQDQMKAANAAVRKNPKITRAELYEIAPKDLVDDALNYAQRWGGDKNKVFPAYMLTNNNAKIAEARRRLEEEQTKESKGSTEYRFQGGHAVADAADNRFRLHFDEKPDAATIAALKKGGFRWSPTNMAWQRHYGSQSVYAAKQIVGDITPVTPAQPGSRTKRTVTKPQTKLIPKAKKQGEKPAAEPTATVTGKGKRASRKIEKPSLAIRKVVVSAKRKRSGNYNYFAHFIESLPQRKAEYFEGGKKRKGTLVTLPSGQEIPYTKVPKTRSEKANNDRLWREYSQIQDAKTARIERVRPPMREGSKKYEQLMRKLAAYFGGTFFKGAKGSTKGTPPVNTTAYTFTFDSPENTHKLSQVVFPGIKEKEQTGSRIIFYVKESSKKEFLETIEKYVKDPYLILKFFPSQKYGTGSNSPKSKLEKGQEEIVKRLGEFKKQLDKAKSEKERKDIKGAMRELWQQANPSATFSGPSAGTAATISLIQAMIGIKPRKSR